MSDTHVLHACGQEFLVLKYSYYYNSIQFLICWTVMKFVSLIDKTISGLSKLLKKTLLEYPKIS